MNSRRIQIGALASLLVGAQALAHDPGGAFAERIEEAELVFEGRVLGEEYVLSEPDDMTGARIPHTFVTFAVERVFKGRVESDSITLRFFGGLDRDGTMLTSTVVPFFDPGEQVILLVRANGRADSPLVGWRFGRFRVIGERVYDDFGQEIILRGADDLIRGRRHAFVEVVKHRLGDSDFESNLSDRIEERDPFDADAPDALGPRVEAEPNAGNRAVDVRSFRSWISDIVRRHLDPLESSRPVASADPRHPFSPRSVRPAAADKP